MANRRTTFDKLQRERDKKAKAAAKRDRRQERAKAPTEDDGGLAATAAGHDGELSAPELLALIEEIHRQFDSHEIDLDEFEEKKADLLSRLPVD